MSAPRPHWFEHPLGQHLDALFVLDVDLPAPPSLRAWLDEPLTTRGLPRAGPPPASAAAAQPVVRHHRPHPTGHDRWTGYDIQPLSAGTWGMIKAGSRRVVLHEKPCYPRWTATFRQ